MFTTESNRVSRVWFLGLFGVLVFNLSALPSPRHNRSGSRDLASTTGADTCENQIDQNDSAECTLSVNVNGHHVVSKVTVTTVQNPPSHARDKNGALVPIPGGTELAATFQPLTDDDCHCGDAGTLTVDKLNIPVADFKKLAEAIDEKFVGGANQLAGQTVQREKVAAQQAQDQQTHLERQNACLENAQGQPLVGPDAQVGCQVDQVASLDPVPGAAYYTKNIQPVLTRRLGSPDPNERARAYVTLKSLDLISELNPYINQSVNELEKFQKYAEDGYATLDRLNKATTPAEKQQWAQMLAAKKQGWEAELQRDSQRPVPTPEGFNDIAYRGNLGDEIKTPRTGYIAQLNAIGTVPGPTTAGTTAGEGRTARGNESEKPAPPALRPNSSPSRGATAAAAKPGVGIPKLGQSVILTH